QDNGTNPTDDTVKAPAKRSDEPIGADYRISERYRLLVGPENACLYLILNNQDGFLSDPRVRRALSLAIDREALMGDVYNGLHKAAVCGVVPSALQDRVASRFAQINAQEASDARKAEQEAREANSSQTAQNATEGVNATVNASEQVNSTEPASNGTVEPQNAIEPGNATVSNDTDTGNTTLTDGNDSNTTVSRPSTLPVVPKSPIDVHWDDLRYDPRAAILLLGEAGYGKRELYDQAMLEYLREQREIALAQDPENPDLLAAMEEEISFDSPALNSPVVILSCDTDADNIKLMAEVARYLQDVGISAGVRNMEWSLFFDSLVRGDFQIAPMSWIAEYPSADVFLRPLLQSGSPGNVARYNNADYDQALMVALATQDERSRLRAFQELDMLAGEDMPIVPILEYCHHHVVSDRVLSLYYGRDGRANLETCTSR
ncbi:MAG: hypothetical protein IJJ14_08810, partial [Coriobacteriales bacterium]|nr:hypothetical protein [Coriobacteriales bacterium]